MAVHGPDGLVAVGNALAQRLDEVAIQLGYGITHGVGHVDGGGTLGDHRLEHTAEEVRVAAVAVFGAELDVTDQIARKAHRLLGLFQHLVRRHAQLLFHVQRAGGNERVDARTVGTLERFRGPRDVPVIGTRQRADGRILDRIGNDLHCIEIAVGAGSKPGFDHVHLQTLELARNAQLLVLGHRGAGGLLAVAQGGVENDEFVSHVVSPGSGGVEGGSGVHPQH